MTKEAITQLHADRNHWHLIFFYFCPEDPRIVVKKRIGITGWTLNFARLLAIPFLITLISAIYGVFILCSHYALKDFTQWLVLFAVIIATVILCGWMADASRFSKHDKS